MSYTTVYKIAADGSLHDGGQAKNSRGFACLVWTQLGNAYGLPENYSMPELPIWKELATGKLTEDEDIVMGATFDRVWVRKEGLPRLVSALRAFYEKYGQGKVDTILGVANLIESFMGEDVRGACFQVTSLSSQLWLVPPRLLTPEELAAAGVPPLVEGESYTHDDYQLYDFARDAGKNRGYGGKEPWELFAALEANRPGFKLDPGR